MLAKCAAAAAAGVALHVHMTARVFSSIYTVNQKKTRHWTFVRNFDITDFHCCSDRFNGKFAIK